MTVTNRAWDTQAGPGFVRWDTEFPDETGQGYPGPGTFGTHTSDYCIARGQAVVTGPEVSPDDTFSPVEQWLLNGTLLGENAVENVDTLRSGVEAYASGPIAGTQGFDFTGQLIDTGTPIDASLQITGNLSVQFWFYPIASGTFGGRIYSCTWRENGGDGNNPFFSGIGTSAGNPGEITFGWEETTSATSSGITSSIAVSLNEWHHCVMTRDVSGGANAVKARIYLDGVLRASSDVLDLAGPTSANTVYIRMGDATNSPPADANNQTYTGRTHGFTIYDRAALTQAEVIALYKKGIPAVDR